MPCREGFGEGRTSEAAAGGERERPARRYGSFLPASEVGAILFLACGIQMRSFPCGGRSVAFNAATLTRDWRGRGRWRDDERCN